MKNRVLAFGLLAPIVCVMAGCSDSSMADRVQSCLNTSMRENRMAWWAQGSWRIHGVGKRFGCTDTHLNSDDIELGAQVFRVRQAGYSLRLESMSAASSPPSFSLDGTVGASCIRFSTVEAADNSEIRYDFPGEFLGTSTVRGEFTGFGPGTCRTEGDFELSIALDPLPKRPERDGGAADSSIPPPYDAGDGRDSAAHPDSGVASDSGAAIDSGATTDSGAAIDGGATSDNDAATGVDGGAAIDSDAATGADSGAASPDSGSADASDGHSDGSEAGYDPTGGNVGVAHDGGLPDADAERPDAGITEPGSPDDYSYELWNGSAEVSGELKGKASCSAATRPVGGWSGIGALAGAAMLLCIRKRRRLPGSKV